NTMIDTLLKQRSNFRKPTIWDELNLKKSNYIIITLHRPANVDETSHLAELLEEIVANTKDLQLVFPVHPRTNKQLEKLGINHHRLHMIEPLSYLEFNYLV